MTSMENESFFTLLSNLAHWEFELFISVIFAFLEYLLIRPFFNKWSKHHKGDDDQIAELQARVSKLEHAETT